MLIECRKWILLHSSPESAPVIRCFTRSSLFSETVGTPHPGHPWSSTLQLPCIPLQLLSPSALCRQWESDLNLHRHDILPLLSSRPRGLKRPYLHLRAAKMSSTGGNPPPAATYAERYVATMPKDVSRRGRGMRRQVMAKAAVRLLPPLPYPYPRPAPGKAHGLAMAAPAPGRRWLLRTHPPIPAAVALTHLPSGRWGSHAHARVARGSAAVTIPHL